jgi:hypothetical protein
MYPFVQSPRRAFHSPTLVTQKQGCGWESFSLSSHQRCVAQACVHQRPEAGDRERVAVQEHEEVVVVGDMDDLQREMVQLVRVRAPLSDHVVEVPTV